MNITAGNQRKYRHALLHASRDGNWLLTLLNKAFNVGEEEDDDE